MRERNVGRRVRRFTAALAFAATIGLVPAVPALAADTADQSNTASGTVTFIHDVIVDAQTYTAGLTGSLNRVDLGVGRLDDPGSLTVRIETAVGGKPSGTVLATATVPASAVPDDGLPHTLTIALPASLSTAGAQYAIVLAAAKAAQDTAWLWQVDSLNGYGGGAALEGDTFKGTWSQASDDRTFATYVDPTPCAGGTYSSTGYGPCTPADPGHYATGPGATSQTPCGLGSYAPVAGAAACLPAPVGTYVDSTGATAPTACPAGTTTAGPGAMSADACVSGDTTPPVITANVTGTLGVNGWYTSDVTLTWSVSEPETPGSLVLTGCVDQLITTDQGPTTYFCSATSTGGSAGPTTVTIARDTAAPTLTCTASPSVIWPPNGRFVPVSVAVRVSDASGFSLVSATSSEGAPGDLTGWAIGSADTSGQVRARRDGSGDGRTYTFTYRAVDQAGNTGTCAATVRVPHDRGR